MIASSGWESSQSSRLPEFFGLLELPFGADTWEYAQDQEVAEGVMDDMARFMEVVRKLRHDGWQLTYEWDEDDARYIVSHERYRCANDANKRLQELGIRRLRCIDVADLRLLSE
jgi:hypothetical protein